MGLHCSVGSRGRWCMEFRWVVDLELFLRTRCPGIMKGLREAVVYRIAVLAIAGLLSSCGGSKEPVPSILNINNSTTPSSPLGVPIEINGSGFQDAPGKVVFTQSGISITVTPNSSGWTSAGIVVTVP